MSTPRSEPYHLTVSTLASGLVYVVGPNGDDDPERALEQVVISNTGATALRVASDLTGIQGTAHLIIPAGTMAPVEGPRNSLVLKTNTAAASTFSASAERFYGNAAKHGGTKPALSNGRNRRWPGRLSFVANTATATTVKLKQRFTITAIKLYAGAAPTGASITLTIADRLGRNLLSATNFNLETLVAGTLTTLTLTTSTDLLTVGPEDLVFTITSTGGGDVCSVAFELTFTEA